jgi:hypothetical protein
LHRNTANKSLKVLKTLGYINDAGINLTPQKTHKTGGNGADFVSVALALVGSTRHKVSANNEQNLCNAQDLTQHKDCAIDAQEAGTQDLCMPKCCAENGTNVVPSIKNNCKSKQDTTLECSTIIAGAFVSVGRPALPVVFSTFADLMRGAGSGFGVSSDAGLGGRLLAGSNVQAVGVV